MACTASALRLHIRGSLLDGYLSSNAAPTASTAWLYAVTDSSITDPVLEDALSALSLACMEQSDLTGRSPQQGRIMYGRTMMRLYHRLDRSDAVDMARSDATLAAIMLLNAYEVRVTYISCPTMFCKLTCNRHKQLLTRMLAVGSLMRKVLMI